MLSVREQYNAGRAAMSAKWDVSRCIPYFQAHTNTYAPTYVLSRLFNEALTYDSAIGLDIATRADCLPPDVCALLAEIAEKTDLTVELGLQSSMMIRHVLSEEDMILRHSAMGTQGFALRQIRSPFAFTSFWACPARTMK